VGAFNKGRTEKGFATLQEYLARKAEVLQNHHVFLVYAEELSQGDIAA